MMDFAYYMCDNGTEDDKRKDIEDLLRLVDVGYVAFRESREGRITVYRPFRLGVMLAGNPGEEYRFNRWACQQEC